MPQEKKIRHRRKKANSLPPTPTRGRNWRHEGHMATLCGLNGGVRGAKIPREIHSHGKKQVNPLLSV